MRPPGEALIVGQVLSNRYLELAKACSATPEQLDHVVSELLALKDRYYELLSSLVFHPNMREQTLMIYEQDCCITELGHRGGPQRLLERIAQEKRYSEAITTLALQYYSDPDYPTELFAAFLNEHATDRMLGGNLLRQRNLPSDKWKIVRDILGS